MKIRILHIIIVVIIGIPLLSYVDTIRIGTYPYQQYLAINLWEAGILFVGIVLGMILNKDILK